MLDKGCEDADDDDGEVGEIHGISYVNDECFSGSLFFCVQNE